METLVSDENMRACRWTLGRWWALIPGVVLRSSEQILHVRWMHVCQWCVAELVWWNINLSRSRFFPPSSHAFIIYTHTVSTCYSSVNPKVFFLQLHACPPPTSASLTLRLLHLLQQLPFFSSGPCLAFHASYFLIFSNPFLLSSACSNSVSRLHRFPPSHQSHLHVFLLQLSSVTPFAPRWCALCGTHGTTFGSCLFFANWLILLF